MRSVLLQPPHHPEASPFETNDHTVANRQLLPTRVLVWALSHFWKIPTLVLSNMSSPNFSPLREFLAKEWPKIKRSKWVDIFKDCHDEEIVCLGWNWLRSIVGVMTIRLTTICSCYCWP
ncbi:hypothetical protein GQ457_10G013380 [Hibiscus cannabinus]